VGKTVERVGSGGRGTANPGQAPVIRTKPSVQAPARRPCNGARACAPPTRAVAVPFGARPRMLGMCALPCCRCPRPSGVGHDTLAYGCRVRSVYLALSGRAVQADRTERLGWRTSSRISSSSSIQPASIYIDFVWFCPRIILTANYGVKQTQFTKSTSEIRASDPKESNEAFDRTIRGWLL